MEMLILLVVLQISVTLNSRQIEVSDELVGTQLHPVDSMTFIPVVSETGDSHFVTKSPIPCKQIL